MFAHQIQACLNPNTSRVESCCNILLIVIPLVRDWIINPIVTRQQLFFQLWWMGKFPLFIPT
ncbi:hypothetical protein KFU94_13650 [Chloroflexi bacterium TSY]|nr:hypothetical protein [Chloroflexi bacterium TSY]